MVFIDFLVILWYDKNEHGRVFVNNNILITDNDIKSAQELCGKITSLEKRNRAVANMLAVKISEKVFEGESYDVDSKTGLCTIPDIAQIYDIADVYINGTYIDVRLFFNENEMSVPKSHFDSGIVPYAYMFVQISEDLKNATVLGYLTPDKIKQSDDSNEYYPVLKEDLVQFEEVSRYLISYPSSDSEIEDVKIYKFLDKTYADEQTLVKELIKSKASRVKFEKIYNAQKDLFNTVLPEQSSEFEIAEEVQDEVQEYEQIENEEVTEDDLAELFDENSLQEQQDADEYNEYSTEVTESGASIIESVNKEEAEKNEDIDSLFEESEGSSVNTQSMKKKKSSTGKLFILFVFACLLGGGYYLYSNNMVSIPFISQKEIKDISEPVMPDNKPATDAMPVETVEDLKTPENTEEGNAISIPAIEQNLDASVLVANLKVDWEVPEGYATNTTAKRYLVKIGKIIQLNLKTDLLLLSKPPISNTVAVNIKFNENTNKFEVVDIAKSSGEKTVDKAILTTVKTVLSMNISTNTDSFSKLQGNPTLIIHF